MVYNKSKTHKYYKRARKYKHKKRLTYAKKQLVMESGKHKPEEKDLSFQYGSQISAAQTTASQIFCVNAVRAINDTPGLPPSSANSRIGRDISGVRLDYDWCVGAAGLNYPCRIQAKVFLQKENPSGSTPSATDIFSTDNIYALRNLDTIDNFVCLATIDPEMHIAGYATGGAWNATYHAKGSIDLKGTLTRFNSLFTSGVTSMESGLLWIVTYGQSDIVSVASYSHFNVRYRFTDC